MNFVPYTELSVATACAMRFYEYEAVNVSGGEFAYSAFLLARWRKRHDFLVVEHDVVPWPGAIESLWECPEPWCAYDYDQHQIVPASIWSPPLGCVRFRDALLRDTEGLWDGAVDWHHCDTHLVRGARAAGYRPHRHFPNVVHASAAELPSGSWPLHSSTRELPS